MNEEYREEKRKIPISLLILLISIIGILILAILLLYSFRVVEIILFNLHITSSTIIEALIIYTAITMSLYIIILVNPSIFTRMKFTRLKKSKKVKKVGEEEKKPEKIVIGEPVEKESLPTVEVYPVNPPYVYISIVRIGNSLEYHVLEPALTDADQEWIDKIDRVIYEEMNIDLSSLDSKGSAEEYLREFIKKIVKRYKWNIDSLTLEKIMYYIVRNRIGYSKIDALMRDENIEDISCNGPGQPVYVYHRFYESLPTNIVFDEVELDNFVVRLSYISGRHVSISTPIVDATLPDGTRINITFRREISRHGSTFSIRKFRKEPFTIIDLIKFKTLNDDIAAFIWEIVENMASILVAGGTATGKTTLLNAISLFLKPEIKIVSIEDTAELQLYHKNWNPLVERTGFGIRGSEAEIRMFDLLKTALRQRPDVIIVGEVRGEEAYTMFQAMATGHGGLGSIHAESPKAVIDRLMSEPMNVPPALILTLDLIILISRVKIGEKIYRKVISVSEPYWNDELKRIELNKVFTWDAYTDTYKYSGRSNTMKNISLTRGINMEEIKRDIDRKKMILKWMIKKNIRNYKKFIEIMSRYYRNPDELYDIATFELYSVEGG